MTDSFFDRLKNNAAHEWAEYCEHEFVEQLGKGTLPEAAFVEYMVQDYIFLIHFSRAWALAVFKSDNLADMRDAATTLNALLNHEMALHVEYGKRFNITADEMEQANEAPANMAYTRYVLERGLSGDILDLHVALAPCVIGYGEIGKRLATEYSASLETNPYREWIEMYSSDEYLDVANGAVALINRLAAARATEERFDRLATTFRQASILERDFWQMGLDAAK